MTARTTKKFRQLAAFPRIDLTEILVRWDEATTVSVGPVSSETVDLLRKEDFDQAPVLNVDGHVLGLISTSRLGELSASGKHLAADDAEWINDAIMSCPGLDVLLQSMATKPVATVEIHSSDPCTGQSHITSPGFITVSDLNKHPLRAKIYPLVAELESKLARMVDKRFQDPWDWLSKLDKDKQARLVGYWELSKRDKVDIGPIATTTLTELFRIVACDAELRSKLRFESRNKWDDFTGRIADFRNAVMHPVRPLISTQDEVLHVRGVLDRVIDLVNRTGELLSPAETPSASSTV